MLTDTKLRNLKARATVYRIADAQGLCVEVRPTGARYWRYRYRYVDKASMLTLGEYPAMSLVEARAERDRFRALLQAGGDPAAAKRAEKAIRSERAANSFAAIGSEYLEKRVGKLGAGSVARIRRLLEKDLNPFVGHLPIADVSAPELLRALRHIEARGAVETAHRTRALASQIFRYGIATGRADRDPAADLQGALESPTKRHLASMTEPEQVASLLPALWSYQGTPAVMAAMKLAPLLFVRPGELRTARWADIDLDTAEWRFIASKTQTPHIVPLASQCIDILRDLQRFTGRSDYVFPGGRSPRRPMSENAVTAALRTLGFTGDQMTGHGFRAMARTMLDEVLGFRPECIENQLAHAVRDPNGRAYNRTKHLVERTKMMQAWADYLEGLRLGGNVAPIKSIAA